MTFTEAINYKKIDLDVYNLPDRVKDDDTKIKALKYFGVSGNINMDKVEIFRFKNTKTYILRWEQ